MFENFCTNNGISHLTSPTFHAASNGAAENFVKAFKYSSTKMIQDSTNDTLHTRLQKFLYLYRNSPHTTTNRNPAELMFNRKLNIRFDQLRKNKVENKQNNNSRLISITNNKTFHKDETVYVRDYKYPNKRGWVPAKVVESIGKYIYLCETDDGSIFKRHIDQMVPVGEFFRMKNIGSDSLREENKTHLSDPKPLINQPTVRKTNLAKSKALF
uniref:Uncharacterized protein K02A2.6 n=1 Tax=Lygus hesperus TaxID=30085 RepID=A0A146KZ67_LYGHE